MHFERHANPSEEAALAADFITATPKLFKKLQKIVKNQPICYSAIFAIEYEHSRLMLVFRQATSIMGCRVKSRDNRNPLLAWHSHCFYQRKTKKANGRFSGIAES